MKELTKNLLDHLGFLGQARRMRNFLTNTITAFYRNRLKSPYWREHHFNTLGGVYAVSEHEEENYVVRTSDKVIGKLLYCRGDFDLQKFIRSMHIIDEERGTGKRKLLIDVGANIGPICIPAVRRGYVERVIAFEPDPENFRLLRINAILNGVEDRIESHQIALGASHGVAQLIHNNTNHGDHRIETGGCSTEGGSVVQVRCLDDYWSTEKDIESILWIDVQGFEAHVLKGAQKAFSERCPLVLEFTPKDLNQNGTFNDLISLLTRSDYSIFFDLEHSTPLKMALNQENLVALAQRLEERDTFTDILVV